MLVLDKNKVIKLEVCTSKGKALLTLTKNFVFPQKLVNENERFEPNQSVFIKGKNLPVFARNASVTVIAHTRAGDRFSFPAHIAASTDFQLNITLSQVKAELLPERRRYYKVEEQIPCLITSITRGEKHVECEPPLAFMIQDINIGGVFLGGSELVELKKEDILAIVVKEGMGNTEFVAKILRVVTRDEKITGYGCCFLFVNARQEEVVAKFINKLQVHRIATERAEAAEIVDTSRFT